MRWEHTPIIYITGKNNTTNPLTQQKEDLPTIRQGGKFDTLPESTTRLAGTTSVLLNQIACKAAQSSLLLSSSYANSYYCDKFPSAPTIQRALSAVSSINNVAPGRQSVEKS